MGIFLWKSRLWLVDVSLFLKGVIPNIYIYTHNPWSGKSYSPSSRKDDRGFWTLLILDVHCSSLFVIVHQILQAWPLMKLGCFCLHGRGTSIFTDLFLSGPETSECNFEAEGWQSLDVGNNRLLVFFFVFLVFDKASWTGQCFLCFPFSGSDFKKLAAWGKMRKLLKGEQKDEQKGDSAEIAQGRKVQERYREGAGQAWRGGNSGLGSPLFRVFLSFCWPSQSPFHHFFYTWKRWKKGEQKGDLKKQSQMQSDASRESGSGTGEGDFLCRSPWWYLLAFHIDPRKPNQNHAPYVMLCVMKAHDILFQSKIPLPLGIGW